MMICVYSDCRPWPMDSGVQAGIMFCFETIRIVAGVECKKEGVNVNGYKAQ